MKWLEAFNKDQQRLPQRRFELLLWRLEVANAEATDAALAAAGELKTLSATCSSSRQVLQRLADRTIALLRPALEAQAVGVMQNVCSLDG